MAYLDAKSFVFDGRNCEEFGVMIAWFGKGNDSNVKTGLNVELQRGEINAIRTNPNLYSAVYEDTLTWEFGIIPKCGRDIFTFEESRELNRWLRHSNGYKLLRFNDNLPEQINYYAICTGIEDVVYSGRNGKLLTFTCNSPFGYSPKVEKEYQIGELPTEFNVFNNSDNGTYYPIITITVPDDYTGSVVLENITDRNAATFDFNIIESKTIIIDSEKGKITDDGGTLIPAYKVGWDDMSQIYWFRLLEGWNEIRATGTSTIKFQCEFPRKVGIL